MDTTTDIQIGGDQRGAGFRHVDDPGNFEVYSNLNLKRRYQNHPAGAWTLSLVGWVQDQVDGGGALDAGNIEVLEIE